MVYIKKGNMITLIVILCLLFLLVSRDSWAACTGSSPTWFSTPDQPSIQTCVNNASTGDTINVSAGAVTYSSRLDISKGINIIGAGIDNTIIRGSSGLDWLIYYTPDWNLNPPFRLTGFTFDLNSTTSIIRLKSSNTSLVVQTKVRIDHNKFQNCPALTTYQAIWVEGVRGVIDHNTFENIKYPIRAPATSSSGSAWWDKLTGVVFGTSNNNMYFEDNTFTGVEVLVDCQYGNRYAFRYNTINTAFASWPLMDMHGNQGGDMWSCFGGEVYGNQINAGTYDVRLLDHRGGRAVVFNNNLASTGSFGIQVRDEFDDALNPTLNQPQHVVDSYYWNNRKNLTGAVASVIVSAQAAQSLEGGRQAPQLDVDAFVYSSTFDGASGMGCGTLENRPATCTTGVGYWATNQSCTDLTGMAGVNPVTPITGTLYKCTATNTWTAYYTPYTYPHPLQKQLKPPDRVKFK